MSTSAGYAPPRRHTGAYIIVITALEVVTEFTDNGSASLRWISIVSNYLGFGLSPAVTGAARERLSFSRMTFTHQMIRLLLVEQIYRAFKIARGEKYHW